MENKTNNELNTNPIATAHNKKIVLKILLKRQCVKPI